MEPTLQTAEAEQESAQARQPLVPRLRRGKSRLRHARNPLTDVSATNGASPLAQPQPASMQGDDGP